MLVRTSLVRPLLTVGIAGQVFVTVVVLLKQLGKRFRRKLLSVALPRQCGKAAAVGCKGNEAEKLHTVWKEKRQQKRPKRRKNNFRPKAISVCSITCGVETEDLKFSWVVCFGCAPGVLRVCSGCTTYVCAWRNENGKANISTFKWTTHREPLESLDERSEIELNVRSSERNQRRQLSLHVRQWPKEREREREGKNVQTNANSERWNPNNKVLNFGFQLQEDRPKGNQLRKMLTVVDAINTRIWLQLGTKERQT